jgi:hypothetical protein
MRSKNSIHYFDARDPRRRANEEHRRAHTRYRPVHRASVPLLHLLAPQSAPRARPAREASSSATRNDRDCRNAQLCVHRCARAAEGARRATRARQRYAARGIHLFDVHPRHSYHLTRLFWAARAQSSVRSLTNASIDAVSWTTPSARATGTHRMPVARARWASSARLPSRFRLADPIRAPPLPFSLRRSRSRRAAPGTLPFFSLTPRPRLRARGRFPSSCRLENSSKFTTPSLTTSRTLRARGGARARASGTSAMLFGVCRSRSWWPPCRSTCGRTPASGTCTRAREMRAGPNMGETRNDEKTRI